MEKWARVKYFPCLPLGEDGKRVTASKEHIEISRTVAGEGMVLLKNNNNVLPLKLNQKVAIFGKGQCDYVKGGGGSGYVFSPYTRNIFEGLKVKETENKIQVFNKLYDFYRENVKEQYAELRKVRTIDIEGRGEGFTTEPEIPAELLEEAKRFTDTAIITICRFSLEAYDRKGEEYDGDF